MVMLGRAIGITVLLAMVLACSAESGDPGPLGEGGRMGEGGAGGTPGPGPGPGGSGGGGGSGGSGYPPHGCAAQSLPGSLADGRWSERFIAPGLSGRDGYGPRVHDFALDSEGRLVAVGYFSFAGEDPVPAAVRWNGADWEPLFPSWEASPPVFSTIAIRDDGAIALTTHDPLTAQGEVILVRRGLAAVIGTFEGFVRKLHWQGDRLWMAGLYWMREGPEHLAIWEDGSWSGAAGGNPDMAVFEIVEEGGSIVVAGEFETIGGIPAEKMAIWDGATWTANDLPLIGRIFALTRDDHGAWIAAGFLVEPGSSYGGVFRQLEDESWELMGGGLNNGWLPGMVSAMTHHEGALYAAGCFREDSEGNPIPPIVRWDGSSWVPAVEGKGTIRPWFDPATCGDEGPAAIFETIHQRMISVDDRLYLGGAFGGVGDTASVSIAVRKEGAWAPMGHGSDDVVMGFITRMETGGPACTLYAAGAISHVGATPTASALLRWDDGWEPYGPPIQLGLECVSHAVAEDERVFVGCREPFSDDQEEAGVAHLFELTEDQWIPLGELPPGQVFDLEFDAAGHLWIGGGYGDSGFLARWGGEAIELIESGFDGPVVHLAVEPGAPEPDVIVAGSFLHRQGEGLEMIARYDGKSWHPMGQDIEPVTALAWSGMGIFMGTQRPRSDGFFPMGVGDSAAKREDFVFARWTGSGWEELGTAENGLPPVVYEDAAHTFRELVPTLDGLIAVGDVWTEQGPRNAFFWDGERFLDIGGGVGSIGLDTAALTPAGLFFGGMIATVDPNGAVRPSVGAALFEWR